MRTIWKYPMHPGVNELTMPYGSQILDVQMQDGEPWMWTLVPDSCGPPETRTFKIYGTGHNVLEACHRLHHISTFQMKDEALVWHVFEIKD